MNYSYSDLLHIAKGQLILEEKHFDALQNKKTLHPDLPNVNTEHSLLFIDTNMYVMKVWSEFVFGKCHDWILQQIADRTYDLYFLCNTDLPWVKDELREYPDLESRQRLFYIYQDTMIHQTIPWVTISGNYEERFQKQLQQWTIYWLHNKILLFLRHLLCMHS